MGWILQFVEGKEWRISERKLSYLLKIQRDFATIDNYLSDLLCVLPLIPHHQEKHLTMPVSDAIKSVIGNWLFYLNAKLAKKREDSGLQVWVQLAL